MTYILFFWITGARLAQPSVSSQEFNSRANCVHAALALQPNFDQNFNFICIEKGKVTK